MAVLTIDFLVVHPAYQTAPQVLDDTRDHEQLGGWTTSSTSIRSRGKWEKGSGGPSRTM
jgi:hypothetical protein